MTGAATSKLINIKTKMTLTNLITDTLFLSNTVAAQYPSASITNNINRYYDEVVSLIWSADNSWNFDEGVGYLPIAYTNLVADQADYQLPSTARQIFRVTILDDSDTEQQLHPLSDKEMPSTSKMSNEEITGTPTGYRMVGRSVVLSPTPDYSKTAGLIIELSKSVTVLSTGTDEPKIDREFHRYLSNGATKDWYFSKSNITKKREMERELERMRVAIKYFYAHRHQDYEPAKIKREVENYK